MLKLWKIGIQAGIFEQLSKMPVKKAIYLITTLIFSSRLELKVARGNDNPQPAEKIPA